MPFDVYVFSSEVAYSLVDRYRERGMPTGLRYVASLVGPWHVFGIISDVDDLTGVPELLMASFGGGSDVATSTPLLRPVTKRSDYKEQTLLVRINVGEADAWEVAEQVRGITHEADAVLGSFDVIAAINGSNDEETLNTLKAIRGVNGITRTLSLRVIDYVSTSADAPEDHRPKG